MGSAPMSVARRLGLAAVIFLAACGISPPPSLSPEDPDAWPQCTGAAYTVVYPPGWFVHPADEAAGIGDCQLFAVEPFSDPAPPGAWGWPGAQIVLNAGVGCTGSFAVAITQDELEIDGKHAFRATLRPGEGDRTLRAYEYFVQLSPNPPCERSAWFQARTESTDPGSF